MLGKSKKIFNIDSLNNIYSYEIEKFSENIIEKNYKVKYPGLSFEETFLNTKILDSWLN